MNYTIAFDDTQRHLMSVVLEQAVELQILDTQELHAWMTARGGMTVYERDITERDREVLVFVLDSFPTYPHTKNEQYELLEMLRDLPTQNEGNPIHGLCY